MAVEKNLLMFAICVILGTLASQATSRTVYRASISEKFEQWMAEYGRVYHDNTEKQRRFAIFKKNVEFVEKFNNDGNKTYKLSINQFSDLTEEEFLNHHTGYKTASDSSFTTSSEDESFMYQSLSTDEIPARMDWREHGAVTPIKDQQGCRACWAFAAVAAVEGITKIKTGKLVSLSEQQVLECNEDDFRCKLPGDIRSAFIYIMNNGLATEEEYPYVNSSEQTMHMCNTSKATNEHMHAANITSFRRVYGTDLLQAVSRQPVSVAIDGYGKEFRRYDGGLFNGPCESSIHNLNHAVTIIGYGTENDTNYWLIKNSWGTTWGEKGYMRILRTNHSGLCGLDLYAYYPII